MNNTTNNTKEIDNVLSGYTKGKWSYHKITDGGYVIKEKGLYEKGFSDRIAELYEYRENIEANAKLIAAAPDLLEALKLIKDCLQQWNSKGTYSNLINHAETFINKATL